MVAERQNLVQDYLNLFYHVNFKLFLFSTYSTHSFATCAYPTNNYHFIILF